MPIEDIVVEELHESGEGQVGVNEDDERVYSLVGSDVEAEIKQKLLLVAPETVNDTDGNPMSRDGGSITPVSHYQGLWIGRVRYARNPTNTFNIAPVGSAGYTFDTTGGSQHITSSRSTINRYAASGTAPDFKNMIGVSGKEGQTVVVDGTTTVVPGELDVAGCDIEVFSYNWEEPHILDSPKVTAEYRVLIAKLTGAVNSQPFRGFAAGEVLFRGARGSRRSDGKWEISFAFSALPNVNNGKLLEEDFKVGDITIESKKGWDYAWAFYGPKPETVGGSTYNVTRPLYAYVERVRPYADLNQLDLPEPE